MKKLLVFMLVVSLLAFAGGAWAAGHDSGTEGNTEAEREASAKAIIQEEAAATTTAAKTVAADVAAALSDSTQIADLPAPEAGATREVISGDAIATPETTTQDNLAKAVAKMPKGSVPVTFPKVTVPANTPKGSIMQVVLYNDTNKFAKTKFANIKSKGLRFYPNPSSATTSSNMWYIYKNPSATKFVKLDAESDKAALNAVQDGALVVLEFKFDSASDSAVLTSNVFNGAGAGEAEEETPTGGVGSSGGGCVAGSSALALAVVALFIAKRRG